MLIQAHRVRSLLLLSTYLYLRITPSIPRNPRVVWKHIGTDGQVGISAAPLRVRPPTRLRDRNATRDLVTVWRFTYLTSNTYIWSVGDVPLLHSGGAGEGPGER